MTALRGGGRLETRDHAGRDVSRFFSTAAIKRLVRERTRGKQKDDIARCAVSSGVASPGDSLSCFFVNGFKLLKLTYQSEVVYKEAIFNWWLNRSGNRACPGVLFEVRSGTSKLDALCAGRLAWAFEIKTEYDHVRRLDLQLRNYRKRFPYVSVVVSSQAIQRIAEVVPPDVGLVSISRSGSIREVRRAALDAERIDPSSSIALLRRGEAISVARRFGIDLSKVPNTQFSEAIKRAVKDVPPNMLARHVSDQLRRRTGVLGVDVVRGLPVGLRATVAGSSLSENEVRTLQRVLDETL